MIRYERLLEGKRAFVNIGAQGIGRAIALLFARHGAHVLFGARREDKLKRVQEELSHLCPEAKGYLVDYSDAAQTQQVCRQVLHEWGGVDILVNVVGINRQGSLHLATDADMELLLETNLKSGLRCIRAFVPGMMQKLSGCIINISSIHSVESMPGFSLYAATKGAVNASARALALDYAKYGVRVNTICPGLILSDAILEEIAGYPQGQERDAFRAMLENMQPMAPGQPEDIANTALFLASDMSRYMTGQILLVDGGASIKAHP